MRYIVGFYVIGLYFDSSKHQRFLVVFKVFLTSKRIQTPYTASIKATLKCVTVSQKTAAKTLYVPSQIFEQGGWPHRATGHEGNQSAESLMTISLKTFWQPYSWSWERPVSYPSTHLHHELCSRHAPVLQYWGILGLILHILSARVRRVTKNSGGQKRN